MADRQWAFSFAKPLSQARGDDDVQAPHAQPNKAYPLEGDDDWESCDESESEQDDNNRARGPMQKTPPRTPCMRNIRRDE